MPKTGFTGSILALSILTQASCIGMGSDLSDSSGNASPGELERGQPWRLTALAGQPLQAQPPITLRFSREGRISGHGGCNRYFGIFSASPNGALTIGQVGATKMLCPEQMALERRFFQALGSVTGFTVAGDRLQLFGYDGELEFYNR